MLYELYGIACTVCSYGLELWETGKLMIVDQRIVYSYFPRFRKASYPHLLLSQPSIYIPRRKEGLIWEIKVLESESTLAVPG